MAGSRTGKNRSAGHCEAGRPDESSSLDRQESQDEWMNIFNELYVRIAVCVAAVKENRRNNARC